jgi:N-methylhydantoinase A/oxoprolinase/acetone carboxylase beta subunit
MVLKKTRLPLKGISESRTDQQVRFESGTITQEGQVIQCRFYDRGSLPSSYGITGPAVIEEATATTFIPEGWNGEIDLFGNILMKRRG